LKTNSKTFLASFCAFVVLNSGSRTQVFKILGGKGRLAHLGSRGFYPEIAVGQKGIRRIGEPERDAFAASVAGRESFPFFHYDVVRQAVLVMEDAINAAVRCALAHAIDGFPEHRLDSRASAISITEIVGCFPEEAMACSLALEE
jgi:hypothetical protein